MDNSYIHFVTLQMPYSHIFIRLSFSKKTIYRNVTTSHNFNETKNTQMNVYANDHARKCIENNNETKLRMKSNGNVKNRNCLPLKYKKK